MGNVIQFPAERKAGFLWAVNGRRRLESWRLKSANGQVVAWRVRQNYEDMASRFYQAFADGRMDEFHALGAELRAMGREIAE